MEIKKIGVVGAGQMGSGIAEVALTSGFQVLMRDVTMEAIKRGKDRIEVGPGKASSEGKDDGR
jgi:3-hydroxybutyryl-CoA dehydrogenase